MGSGGCQGRRGKNWLAQQIMADLPLQIRIYRAVILIVPENTAFPAVLLAERRMLSLDFSLIRKNKGKFLPDRDYFPAATLSINRAEVRLVSRVP